MIAKILVGTAAGDESDATLHMAAEVAATHDAELVVLRLEPLIDARRVFDPAGIPAPTGAEKPLCDAYPHLRIRSSDARGDALRTVCEMAEAERPDLIVVGLGGGKRGNALLSRRASAAWHAGGTGGSQARVRVGAYVVGVAVIFTLFTGPGPLLHDKVAGAGTPLARLATRVFGEDPSVTHRHMHLQERSPVPEGALQIGVGFPVYGLCTWLALGFVRVGARASRRRPRWASPAAVATPP